MDFASVFEEVASFLESRDFSVAVIGGLGLHVHGISRATFDLELVTDQAAQDAVPRQNSVRVAMARLPIARSYRDWRPRRAVDRAFPSIHSHPMLHQITTISGWLRSLLASQPIS